MNATCSNENVFEIAAPVISVAMPVYNGEKYLAEAIESILSQTFTNFELIIINDGSTDNSLKVLQEYEKRDPRIRLISRENRNLATTLNEIVDLAKGKWIARMDQDDISLPQRLQRQLEWIEKTGADVCGSWIQYFGVGDKRVWKTFETDISIKIDMLFKCPFAHPSIFMRTDFVKELRYDKAWEKAEDYELWTRAAMAGWKMTNIQEVLLKYRRHNEQISSSTLNKQQELTSGIQKIYWTYMAKSVGLNNFNSDDSIFSNSRNKINSYEYELVIENLLRKNNPAVNNIIMKGSARICFKFAADNPEAASRLEKLNKKYCSAFPLETKIQLNIVRFFRIRVGGLLFRIGRMYRFLLGGSNI